MTHPKVGLHLLPTERTYTVYIYQLKQTATIHLVKSNCLLASNDSSVLTGPLKVSTIIAPSYE